MKQRNIVCLAALFAASSSVAMAAKLPSISDLVDGLRAITDPAGLAISKVDQMIAAADRDAQDRKNQEWHLVNEPLCAELKNMTTPDQTNAWLNNKRESLRSLKDEVAAEDRARQTYLDNIERSRDALNLSTAPVNSAEHQQLLSNYEAAKNQYYSVGMASSYLPLASALSELKVAEICAAARVAQLRTVPVSVANTPPPKPASQPAQGGTILTAKGSMTTIVGGPRASFPPQTMAFALSIAPDGSVKVPLQRLALLAGNIAADGGFEAKVVTLDPTYQSLPSRALWQSFTMTGTLNRHTGVGQGSLHGSGKSTATGEMMFIKGSWQTAGSP